MAKEQKQTVTAKDVGQTPTGVIQAEKKALTPEEQKARDAKRAARVEAQKRVRAFVAENAEQLGNLASDILMFVGAARTSVRGPAKASVNAAIREALLKAGSKGLSEMDVFKAFKIGRPEMVTKIRILVLCPNPDDRVWVKFSEEDETYRVVGTGAQPPKGWEGYVPSAKESL